MPSGQKKIPIQRPRNRSNGHRIRSNCPQVISENIINHHIPIEPADNQLRSFRGKRKTGYITKINCNIPNLVAAG